MKIKTVKQLMVLLLCCVSLNTMAKTAERPNSYNYNRAIEALQNDDNDEAFEYFKRELKENPKNGYAQTWIAGLLLDKEEYGVSLTYVNKAFKNLPANDKQFISYAYGVRANIYLNLEDTTSALKDLNTAIANQPERIAHYESRGQILYEQKRYDESTRDYDKIIELDEGDVLGYAGKARNHIAKKEYSKAIPLLDFATKLDKEFSQGYAFRAESYIGLKQYAKGLDDIIYALNLDTNEKAFYLMQVLSDSCYHETVEKFQVQKIKEPNNEYWDYCLGVIHEEKNEYKKAIESFKAFMKKRALPQVAERIADCYEELGNYGNALEYRDITIQLDSSYAFYSVEKAITLDNNGNAKEAIKTLDNLIAQKPDFAYAYYRRGYIKEHTSEMKGALEDYSICISLAPSYAYSYLNRGRIYYELGEKDKATADYKKALELDKKGKDAEIAFYCYFYLGNMEKAIASLDSSLTKDDKVIHYESAENNA